MRWTSAVMKGLFVPSPSGAVLPGSVGVGDERAARPARSRQAPVRPHAVAQRAREAALVKGLSRQASRNTRLMRFSASIGRRHLTERRRRPDRACRRGRAWRRRGRDSCGRPPARRGRHRRTAPSVARRACGRTQRTLAWMPAQSRSRPSITSKPELAQRLLRCRRHRCRDWAAWSHAGSCRCR